MAIVVLLIPPMPQIPMIRTLLPDQHAKWTGFVQCVCEFQSVLHNHSRLRANCSILSRYLLQFLQRACIPKGWHRLKEPKHQSSAKRRKKNYKQVISVIHTPINENKTLLIKICQRNHFCNSLYSFLYLLIIFSCFFFLNGLFLFLIFSLYDDVRIVNK